MGLPWGWVTLLGSFSFFCEIGKISFLLFFNFLRFCIFHFPFFGGVFGLVWFGISWIFRVFVFFSFVLKFPFEIWAFYDEDDEFDGNDVVDLLPNSFDGNDVVDLLPNSFDLVAGEDLFEEFIRSSESQGKKGWIFEYLNNEFIWLQASIQNSN